MLSCCWTIRDAGSKTTCTLKTCERVGFPVNVLESCDDSILDGDAEFSHALTMRELFAVLFDFGGTLCGFILGSLRWRAHVRNRLHERSCTCGSQSMYCDPPYLVNDANC